MHKYLPDHSWLGRLVTCLLGLMMVATGGSAQTSDADIPYASHRVAYGVPVALGMYTSAVYLERKTPSGSAISCGGTVIDDVWVLTAAHCVQTEETPHRPVDSSRITVLVGARQLDSPDGRQISVRQVIVHPDYRYSRGSPHDVALLRLDRPAGVPLQVLVSSAGRPIVERDGQSAIVIGYGKTESGQPSKRLLAGDVPIVSQHTCQLAWEKRPRDSLGPHTVCAGHGRSGRTDSCGGDSGGALLVPYGSGNHVQIGVVSWGADAPCGTASRPSVYMSVGHYEPWIRKHVSAAVRFHTPAATSPLPPASASNPALTLPTGPSQPGITAAQPVPALHAPANPSLRPLHPGLPPQVAPSIAHQLRLDLLNRGVVTPGVDLQLRITTSVGGVLVLFSIDAAGMVRQHMPNHLVGRGRPGEMPRTLRAGDQILAPGLYDRFRFSAGPGGWSRMVGMILPDTPEVSSILAEYQDNHVIPDGLAYINTMAGLLSREATRSAQVVERPQTTVPPAVAVADLWYLVSPPEKQ